MRRLLYRAINYQPHTGNAERQTCRCALYSVNVFGYLRNFRPTASPQFLRQLATF
jgi:hypothetical protein